MRELLMSLLCGSLFYLLIMQIAQCITVGLTGGIPEEGEDVEDENTH